MTKQHRKGMLPKQEVTSVASRKGQVVLESADISDLTTVLAGYQPLSTVLTDISALFATSYGEHFLEIANAVAARAYIGAGTGSVSSVGLTSTDFTVSGSPVTSSGSITANLVTQGGFVAGAFGSTANSLVVTVNNKGIVTAITSNPIAIGWSQITSGKPTTLSGYGITDGLTITAAAAAYQPLNAGLTSISGLATTTYGRSLLTSASATALMNGLSASDLTSGTLPTAQTAALTGDVTKAAGTNPTVLATAQPAVHTWAAAQTFTVAPVFTDQTNSRAALGLGTLATQSGTFSGTSSGTNTGDETVTTIKSKLGITTLSGSNTGDQDLSSYLTSATAATTYQPKEATLTGIASTAPTADQLVYANGADSFTTTSFTSFGRTLVGSANAAAARATNGSGLQVLQAETETLILAMTTRPRARVILAYDDLVYALKAAGVWSNLTGLYIFAAPDSQVASLNLVAPSGTAISTSGTVTFTAYQGFAGDGTSGYLNTGILLATGSKFAQDSATFGVVSHNDRAGSATKREFGTFTGQSAFLNIKTTTPSLLARMNDGTGASVVITSALGFSAAARTVAGTVSLYSAGSGAATSPTKTDVSLASTSLPNTANVTFLQSNGANYSDAQLAAGFWGAGLTQTQMNALYTALKAFLSDTTVSAWQ